MFDLRAWLRRHPKPKRIRLHVDDTERIVDLSKNGRIRWMEVEQTVRNSGASVVECLGEDDSILRTTRLAEEDTDAESDDDARDKYEDKLLSKQHTAQAAMLEAYGRNMVRSFNACAKAAAVSQENLVAIVESLANQVIATMSNLHNLSVNMANLITANAQNSVSDGEDKPNEAMMGVLGQLAAKLMSPAPGPAPAHKPNGKP